MNVIGIGDLVVDYYFENKVFKGICGGMTTFNVISHLAKDFQTYAYAVCGNDFEGEIAIKSLNDIGVNTDYIKIENIKTRCFYINIDKENKIFTSKKSCPICGEKKWYETTRLSNKIPAKLISNDSILVLDTINKINLEIVNKFKKKGSKVALDMGQVGNFRYLTQEEILNKLLNKFDLVQLNERVAVFLMEKFKYNLYIDLNKIFNCDLLIITHGKQGATIIYKNKEIKYQLKSIAEEIDPSGAGDAFLSVAIKKWILNKFEMNEKDLNEMFEEASDLSSKIVQKLGARSTILNLYDKNIINEMCLCGAEFQKKNKRKIKKTITNLTHLKTRINTALESKAYEIILNESENMDGVAAFIGTGGSKIPAIFSSKVINTIKGITTLALNPRDIVYRNNKDIKNIFAFSYSGLTEDILYALQNNINVKKYIITKGNENKILSKYSNVQIISYGKKNTNSGKERGFLSFEGVLAPCSLFAKLYYEKFYKKENFEKFLNTRIDFWNEHFEEYFKENKKNLQNILDKKNLLDIFIGDYSESPGYDLESKIVESGIYRVELHEKKNFSHGRFISLEQYEPDGIIYLKNKYTTDYENKLLEYLNNYNKKLIIIESEYDGILGEFDLLIGVQYFIKSISKLLNIDLSKPTYSDNSMKLYKFKGEL